MSTESEGYPVEIELARDALSDFCKTDPTSRDIKDVQALWEKLVKECTANDMMIDSTFWKHTAELLIWTASLFAMDEGLLSRLWELFRYRP